MIDIIQWRASIGLWNCCQCTAGPTRHSIRTESTPGRKKTGSLSLSPLTALLLFLLILITGYLEYNPPSTGIVTHCSWSKVQCTDIITDNWLRSGFNINTCDSVYPPPHLLLLLLLSGDVELNPGPITGDPKNMLRSYYADLANAISSDIIRVTNGLYSKGLIPQQALDDVLVLGLTDYNKAMKLLRVIQGQLEASPNPDQYLIDICHVLINQQHQTLTDIATNILHQLGQLKDSSSLEYITLREMLGDLVDLLAGNAPIITQLNNHLFSSGLIAKAVHIDAQNSFLSPFDRANKLINAVLATFEYHSNPNIAFTSFITALRKVGLTTIATKLMECFRKKGGPSNVYPLARIDSFNFEALKQALMKGKSLAYRVTTAIVQGEARVGKTCLKSLILSLPYKNVSTSCIEAPCIAYYGNFSVEHYAYSTGDEGWNLVDDDEMNDKIIAELQEYATSGIIPTGNEGIGRSTNTGNEPMIIQAAGATIDYSPPTEPFNPLEYCVRNCPVDRFGLHRNWLYFIDSGGQIQFQKLLLAFMPFTSVLFLVVNLSKNLSDPSCQKIQLHNEVVVVDERGLKVEEVLKQVLSAVASNTQRYQSLVKGYIKHPTGRLHVITVGTYRDKYNELIKDSKIESIEEKKKKLIDFIDSVGSICDTNKVLYELDGRKAASGDFEDKVVKEIAEYLHGQAYEVKVPLKWHYFGVILRKKAKDSNGVLAKLLCEEYGKLLSMSLEEVDNALRFFHTLKMLFYYHDSPAKDIVFVKLDSLIDIIRELVIVICQFRCNEKQLSKQMRPQVAKGYLPISLIESTEAFKKIKNIPNLSMKLLDLFNHLKIAAPLDDATLVMPALLPVKDLSDDKSLSNTEQPPLLFYFNKAAPMGLFCAIIVHLLGNRWRITFKNDNFSNYFTLEKDIRAGLSLKAVIIEKYNCIEIHCTSNMKHEVKKDIHDAIIHVMEDKLIDYELPVPGFYCPCSKERDHIAIVNESVFIICENTDTNQDDNISDDEREQYWSWFMNKEEIIAMKAERRKVMDINESKLHTDFEKKLTIEDLERILTALHKGGFSSSEWHDLGLKLGLQQPALNAIKHDKHDADPCLRECSVKWLQKNEATYEGLVDALKKMGQNAAADYITNTFTINEI